MRIDKLFVAAIATFVLGITAFTGSARAIDALKYLSNLQADAAAAEDAKKDKKKKSETKQRVLQQQKGGGAAVNSGAGATRR